MSGAFVIVNKGFSVNPEQLFMIVSYENQGAADFDKAYQISNPFLWSSVQYR